MFPYLALVGLLLLVGLVMVIRWYASADTQSVLRFFKWLAFVIIGFLLIFFVFSGRLGWTFMALPALIPIFLRLRTALRTYKNFSKMIKANKKMSPKSRKKALAKYKRKFRRIQSKL